MYPRIFHIDNFEIFGHKFSSFSIHTYGVILAIAFFAGFYVLLHNVRKYGKIPEKNAYDLFFLIVISALLGAKILYIIVEYNYYLNNPKEIIFALLRLGGVYYGGLILAFVSSVIYLKYLKLPIWVFADYASPAIALGIAIGRWACFSAGCCYGKPSNLPWAVIFKDSYTHQTVGTPLFQKLHPVQLYESISSLIIFIILTLLLRKKRFDGEIFSLLIILYSIARFFIEYLRADERGFLFHGLLSTSQFISLILIPFGFFLFFYLKKKSAPTQ